MKIENKKKNIQEHATSACKRTTNQIVYGGLRFFYILLKSFICRNKYVCNLHYKPDLIINLIFFNSK